VTNESPLWALANEIRGVIVRWLLEHEGKQFYGRFKKVDLLRLTRLEVWSWRHKVSVEEILTLTLPYLRKTLTAAQKTRYGLGCTVAALTGSGNEKILINALAQVYPGNEHRGIWRRSEQRRQMEAERAEETDGLPIREKKFKGIMEAESVEAFVQAYNNRALRARASLNNELRSAKRKRKHYRFNPWL
jgi:hypothetical protein